MSAGCGPECEARGGVSACPPSERSATSRRLLQGGSSPTPHPARPSRSAGFGMLSAQCDDVQGFELSESWSRRIQTGLLVFRLLIACFVRSILRIDIDERFVWLD